MAVGSLLVASFFMRGRMLAWHRFDTLNCIREKHGAILPMPFSRTATAKNTLSTADAMRATRSHQTIIGAMQLCRFPINTLN
jgi:hypothetical protein